MVPHQRHLPRSPQCWFRYKYLHLTVEAQASSACECHQNGDWCPKVIQDLTETSEQAVTAYPQFDNQIYLKDKSKAIHDLNKLSEENVCKDEAKYLQEALQR
eukprot:TRINITY_DN658_c0_g1_i7.p3 TRINITY_DN658_c0_g1~~TRINITY_DN658_c0_g1_i7.p3  ORF type:complete len:102 (-),score=18.55 TRINITY_DN658_c0_g1_i7:713-1018(-)